MPKPSLHDEDSLLDAARAVVLGRGIRGATIAAVAAESGAPTGSIYHRFRSVDELLARAWIRAARRSQAGAFDSTAADPAERLVAGAHAIYDFCLRERDDALLLTSVRRADLAERKLPAALRAELDAVNAPLGPPLRALARDLFGRADRARVDLVVLLLVDLPYGFARRALEAGVPPPPTHRERLEVAVRAVLAAEPSRA